MHTRPLTPPRASAAARPASWRVLPLAGALAFLLAKGSEAVELIVSSGDALNGQTADLEVGLEGAADIGGITFEIGYDGPQLALAEVTPGPALDGVVIAANPQTLPSGSGSLRFSGVAAGGLREGELLRLRFVLPDSGSGDFPVVVRQARATTLRLEEVAVATQDGGFHVATAVGEAGAAPPAATRLLGNYPNPFNPGTHIPYHLAEAAPVSLTVYSLAGGRVRRLELGLQAAGYYDRSTGRTAYWDGRDDHGRQVATGVYLCVLRAGHQQFCGKITLLR